MILSKQTLEPVARYAIPAFWVFHFSNAFESGAHEIRLQAPIYENPDVMTETLREVMRGKLQSSAPPRYVEMVLDWSRERMDIHDIGGVTGVEFPIIDPRLQGMPYQQTFLLQDTSTDQISFNNVLRVRDGMVQKYGYGEEFLVEEHVFVPHPEHTQEGQGWLVGTALDTRQQQTVLSIFDAQNIPAGPIAQARLNGALPLGLHGNFVSG